jgi:serine protease Do
VDGKSLRQAPVAARIIYRSRRDDVAILQLSAKAPGLKPLPVAGADPAAGSRVYAVGSVGVGTEILEQSISEGIVSSSQRVLDDQTYLQHTAAVNPGNSGGALLDEHCEVVGIITLKADLENVSFAIPASRIRAIFSKAGQRLAEP